MATKAPGPKPTPNTPNAPSEEAVRGALFGVIDPELGDNVVDLGMVRGVDIEDDGQVEVRIALTTAGCPLRAQLTKDIEMRVGSVPGVSRVHVAMGEMTGDEKSSLMARARWKAREHAHAQDGRRARTRKRSHAGDGKEPVIRCWRRRGYATTLHPPFCGPPAGRIRHDQRRGSSHRSAG